MSSGSTLWSERAAYPTAVDGQNRMTSLQNTPGLRGWYTADQLEEVQRQREAQLIADMKWDQLRRHWATKHKESK